MDQVKREILDKYKDVPAPTRWEPGPYTDSLQQLRKIDIKSLPRWNIPEVFVISAAPVGTFIQRDQNPYQPKDNKEALRHYMECVEEGAVLLHIHVRDDQGRPTMDPKYLREVIDPLREKYGRKVMIDGGTRAGRTFEETMVPVTEGLFDTATVYPDVGLVGDRLTATHPVLMKAQAEYIEACGVKPMIEIHDPASIDNAKRYLIETGILKKPLMWRLLIGLPGTCYIPHERAMVEAVIYMVNRIREIDPESVIVVSDAARMGIYMTTLGMLLGLHVRVGMEDTIWKYPHKDEIIESTAEVVGSVVEIGRRLGRRPATADEFRKLVGLS